MQHNLIEKSGAWYSYKGERIGQGRENAKQFLRENSDVFKKVDAELRKQLGLVRVEQPATAQHRPATATAGATDMRFMMPIPVPS